MREIELALRDIKNILIALTAQLDQVNKTLAEIAEAGKAVTGERYSAITRKNK